MKRTVLIATLILTLAAGLGTAVAWGGPGGHGRGMAGHSAQWGPGGFLRGMMRVMHRLDLSDQQRDTIRGLLQEARTQIQPHREALEQGREKMRALDPSSFDEAAVRAIAQEQGKQLEEIMVIAQKVRSQVWAMLTPQQREEAKKIRTECQQSRERMRQCMGGTGMPTRSAQTAPTK